MLEWRSYGKLSIPSSRANWTWMLSRRAWLRSIIVRKSLKQVQKYRTENDAALKNADTLLQDVLKAVDTNGDGKIQYSGTS